MWKEQIIATEEFQIIIDFPLLEDGLDLVTHLQRRI